MAKKYWEGDINDLNINTDWGGDESTGGLPLPGSAVQSILKKEIKGKVGYMHENETDGLVYFYPSEQDYMNDEVNNFENAIGKVISTARYTMDLKADKNNKKLFLSNDGKKEFVWYFKTIEIAGDLLYQENVTVEYKFNNISEGKQTTFSTTMSPDPLYNSGDYDEYTKVVLNLDEYLSNGTTEIEINVKGLKTKQERTLSNTIQIITLEMKDNTDFSKSVTNNLIVNVDVTCTKGQAFFFEYRIDNGDLVLDSGDNKGNGSKVSLGYLINLSNVADGKHLFEYRLFVKIDGEEKPYYTKFQRFNFIKGTNVKFSEPQILIYSDYSEGQVTETESGELIINGVSQYVPYTLKYSIYNSNEGSTNVEFIEIVDGKEQGVITNTVSNGVISEYDIQSIEFGMKTIKIITKDGDNNITNGNGTIIYLNIEKSSLSIGLYSTNLRLDFTSVGKTNNDEINKTKWESKVLDGNGSVVYHNNAYFNSAYDWSQGWTDKGLVVGEHSEVVFDYPPFPLQKTNPTAEEANEYVGGSGNGYTFEIEFMTQNVTNEEAIVCDMMDERDGGKCGLQITGSQIKFTTPNGNSVSTRFKSEEMNRATIIIRPKMTANGFKGLVELYVNGVLSNITKYTEDEKFQVISNGKSKNLCFKGADGADIVVKYIRAYNGVMEPDNVVDNYIIYRTDSKEMLNLYNKNNVVNEAGVITPQSMVKLGNIPIIIFIGRTNANELASGDGNNGDGKGNCDEEYKPGEINANEENWYKTLEDTTNKKKNIDMDVIYYNPLDKKKNFKFVKAYITPQGTSSMYYPKKNYRIYTQKNKDTRVFLSTGDAGVLELEQMLKSNFGESEEDRKYEKWRGTKNYKKRKYSFKDNAQPVKCWCLKADFAETSSSHNTGVARLWGDTLKNSTVTINNTEYSVFKTNAQATTEANYNNNINGDMPDVRTTIDGFPIVVFGARSYSDEIKFLGQYNFNNDKSTESVFGFCDIDDEKELTDQAWDYDINEKVENEVHTLDGMLDKYMTCVETLDNGNALANFSTMDTFDSNWDDAFEFRYPEIPEAPEESDYKDDNGNWLEGGEEDYQKDYADYEKNLEYWENTHLKPFRHFAQWIYDTRWCDVDGNKLSDITEEEYIIRKEKWEHLDVWKMAAYYIYAMRFGAVDQIVKNSMLTSEGPFASDKDGNKGGYWDSTNVSSENYGKYYKWYYINYDNDTVLGVKNDGSLAYGPEITRTMKEGSGDTASYIYAGSNSTLWNNLDADEEFQYIVRIADQGISKTMTYKKAIEMFDVEQVGKWCERIYNKDAEYKYINPYVADWTYTGKDENVENFTDKLFMLQGSRTAHRHWWMSKRFNLFDGKWGSGDFPTKYIEVKCDFGSIGDTFGAVAGSNAYFGYQINNKTFGSPLGGETMEYKNNETINWQLFKNIQIGDPIAIYGSTDMLELNLTGLSKNLSSVLFYFGNNADISNKLERFIISVPDELILAKASYENFSDDEEGTVNWQSGFDKLKKKYQSISESDFEEGGKYYNSANTEFDATDSNSPEFYRVEVENEDGDKTFVYFAKISNGIRNYSCKTMSFDALDKLQVLKMAGYQNIPSINLSLNKFINSVDVRYSSISNVVFAEGSRIKEFYASEALTNLSFNNCNNIKLSNIMIDASTLKVNGGINLNVISILNSDGLNHDNEFKTFILNWMKGGAGYKPNNSRELTLTGIKWTNMSIKDIETMLEFKQGANHAITCDIRGEVSMGQNNISHADIDLINRFKEAFDYNIRVRIPYANILIDNVESIVAGETLTVGYTLFSDDEAVLSGGSITYDFVKEVKDNTLPGVYYDANKDKYYLPFSDEELRGGNKNVVLSKNDENKAVIKTNEIIFGEDTEVLLAVFFTIKSDIKFDVTNLIIKDPTYAKSGSIVGSASLTEKGTSYEYNLALLTNKNIEPIGTINKTWSITGEGVEFISESAVTNNGKTLIVKTDEVNSPAKIAKFTVTVDIDNYNPGYSDFSLTKDLAILNENVILTDVSNPIAMDIFFKAGLAVDTDSMSKIEALNVTDIGTLFSNVNEEFSFDEFGYFTNVKTLDNEAFKNSNLTSITLPNSITEIGKSVFENCKKLEAVTLSENIKIINENTFLNCEKLKNVYLPDKVEIIKIYSFGGVGIEKILFKGTESETPKTIFISKNSSLHSIENNAFEVTLFKATNDGVVSTNMLNEVSFSDKLQVNERNYNFLLSNKLTKINISEKNESVLLEDTILYANTDKSSIARAMVCPNNVTPVEIVNLSVRLVYDYAFYCSNGIKNIVFDNSLSNYGLGIGAFYGCNAYEIDLSLCENLTKLKSYSFYNMKNLTKITLPNNDGSLAEVERYVFFNSPYLTELVLPDTIVHFTEENSQSFFLVNCGIKSLKLPKTLLKLPMYSFNECNELLSFSYSDNFIINGDTCIVSYANKLKTINLPIFSRTVKSTNGEWFVSIKGDINRVISEPFESETKANAYLVRIQKLCDEIGYTEYEYVVEFYEYRATIDVNKDFYTKGHISTFNECKNVETFVLNENDDNRLFYATNDGVNNLTNDETNKKSGKSIIRINQDGTKSLVKVVYSANSYKLPDYITYCESGAFSHTLLSSITLTQNISKITSGMFAFTSNLKNLNLPETITDISDYAFYNSGIENIKLSDNITHIGLGAFTYCTFKTFTLPKKLTTIDAASRKNDGVFENCYNLESIIIPENVTRISERLFFNCGSLKIVEVLSPNLSNIDGFAFNGCYALNILKICSRTVPTIYRSRDEFNPGDDSIIYYKYHPFGYNTSFAGSETAGKNILYVPYGTLNSYKSDEDWVVPLLTKTACGFTAELLPIEGSIKVKYDGLNQIWVKSQSGKFDQSTAIFKEDDYFLLVFNNDAYDNEIINIYSDSDKTNKVASFNLKYGQYEYTIGDSVLGATNNTSLFNTRLLKENVSKESLEIVNITKIEYDMILSKIDQLTRLIKLKK